jgi:hypothetical protein
MIARAIALVVQARQRWPLAGDQLYIDLDLSSQNLSPRTLLALGSEARKFVNSPVGQQLNLRGIDANVGQPGNVRVGDVVRKVEISTEKAINSCSSVH